MTDSARVMEHEAGWIDARLPCDDVTAERLASYTPLCLHTEKRQLDLASAGPLGAAAVVKRCGRQLGFNVAIAVITHAAEPENVAWLLDPSLFHDRAFVGTLLRQARPGTGEKLARLLATRMPDILWTGNIALRLLSLVGDF